MNEKTILQFERIFPGIWRARVCANTDTGGMGTSLTAFYKHEPRTEKLDSLPEAGFPFDGAPGGEAFCQSDGCGGTVICLPLRLSERLYGLGLNYQRLCVNYAARQLRCDHYGGQDNGRTHVPAPFYVSDRGYAVLIDTPEPVSFYMGSSVRRDAVNPPPEIHRFREKGWSAVTPAEYVEASFAAGGCDVYVFAASKDSKSPMRDAAARYNLWSGGGFIPPKWGLGMWQRVSGYADGEDVRAEAAAFEEHDMPLSVIGLEPGWQTAAYPSSLDWDEKHFPDHKSLMAELASKGIRLNLWENFFISEKSTLYDPISPYCCSHKVWNGIVPDLGSPEAVEILSRHHKKLAAEGVSGFKVDECDGFDGWLWPDHASFPSGLRGITMRAIYGAVLQRMQDDAFRSLGRRTYGLVRASNAGAAHLPYVIYNDCYSFPQFLTGTASAAFCGALWVPEVRDASTPREWARRFALSALSPILMLNAWASGAKPWKFLEIEDTIRSILRFRQSIAPALYNAFRGWYEEGIPPFRPLCMDWAGGASERGGELDDTENPYSLGELLDVTDEYLIGRDLLAAPVAPDSDTRRIILPPGEWYDFFTMERVENSFTREFALDEIPLYVRGGAVVPTLGEDGALVLRCCGREGEGIIYDDDGESFGYERGEYSLIKVIFADGRADYTVESHGYEPGYGDLRFAFSRD